MRSPVAAAPILVARAVHKQFRRDGGDIVRALHDISLEVAPGQLTALVGPDGAGKTTLLRLAAGLMNLDSGELRVLGVDVTADSQEIQSRIAYMPQRFGLYEDLTVQENLDLYAELHAVTPDQQRSTFPRLMAMTNLAPFTRRLAGKLSGGMKQKLGLACTLVREPELLLLDEPTVGVDPVSRRELWEIIFQLVNDGMTVLVSTSYLDEAENCQNVAVMNEGRFLAVGTPGEIRARVQGRTYVVTPREDQRARSLQARVLDDPLTIDAVPQGGKVRLVTVAGAVPTEQIPALVGLPVVPTQPRFEDAFMVLLADERAGSSASETRLLDHPEIDASGEVTVHVKDLTRLFGSFVAVDHVTFEVHKGEVFGLLGPNGAGKTTTFRMLCGLLAATSGTLTVAGVDVRHARASARQRIGYVAQKFSLYGQLSVAENLTFFASAYGLRGRRQRERVDWAMSEFDLKGLATLPSAQLPGGYKQRLAMAAALMHEPEILFLDEPTSGADPQARREFWRRITVLAEQGVTVIVTTHFMEEAEYCDRAVILDSGRILAEGTPAEIRGRARPAPGDEPDMEAAFLAIVQEARSATILGPTMGVA